MKLRYKILSLTFVLLLTFVYALYERNRFLSLEKGHLEPILQKLPAFTVSLLDGKDKLSSQDLVSKSDAFYIHFWGTWCAPCEAELPEFLQFAKKHEDKSVRFLFIAVNDTSKKVKKFLKDYSVPSNVILALDQRGDSMPYFGTVKVPETYLFNANGEHIRKYVGPQSWVTRAQEADLFKALN